MRKETQENNIKLLDLIKEVDNTTNTNITSSECHSGNQEMSSLFHAVELASNQIRTESLDNSHARTVDDMDDTHEDEYAAMLLGSLSSKSSNVKKSQSMNFIARGTAASSVGRPPLVPTTNSTTFVPISAKPTKRQKIPSPQKRYHSKTSQSPLYSSPDNKNIMGKISSKSNNSPKQSILEIPQSSSTKQNKYFKITTPSSKTNQKHLSHQNSIPSSSQSHQSSTSLHSSKQPQNSKSVHTNYYRNKHPHWNETWDDLPLGKTLGSAALNEFLQYQAEKNYYQYKNAKYIHHDPNYLSHDIQGVGEENPDWISSIKVPKVTARETLQILYSLRVKTSLPPKNSDLHRIVQKSRFDNRKDSSSVTSSNLNITQIGSDSEESPSTSPKKKIASNDSNDTNSTTTEKVKTDSSFKDNDQNDQSEKDTKLLQFHQSLQKLYETMCSQDADDGITFRREARYFSSTHILKQFQSLETKSTMLQKRERDNWKRGQQIRSFLYKTQKSDQNETDPKEDSSRLLFTQKKAYYMGYRFGEEDIDRWMRFPPPTKNDLI